jgi:hypothetical protein
MSIGLLSAPHPVHHLEPSLMQAVFVCEEDKCTAWAIFSPLTTFRNILLQYTKYAANLVHMVVLQIGTIFVSIDQMLADYAYPNGGTMQLNFRLMEKGGTIENLSRATESPNSPMEEQQCSTEDFSYIFRTRGNAPASAAHSNTPVAVEEPQDFPYFFPASRSRTQCNAPAAGASQQPNLPSQERIEDLLHISRTEKEVKQAEKNKKRKNKGGKKAQQPKQSATKNKFTWEPRLIFKDDVNLLSTGFMIPFFGFWIRVLTICIFILNRRAR